MAQEILSRIVTQDDITVLDDRIKIVEEPETAKIDTILEDIKPVKSTRLEDGLKGEEGLKEIHEYSRHTNLYSTFMSAVVGQVFRDYEYPESKALEFHHGDDVLSANKGYILTRNIEGNKLLGAPHNFVDPNEIDRYKMKKIMDKFYRSLVRVNAKMAGII